MGRGTKLVESAILIFGPCAARGHSELSRVGRDDPPRAGAYQCDVICRNQVSNLKFDKKSFVAFRQFTVVFRQRVDLHLHLVMFGLVATLHAIRLVAQSRLEVRDVRAQLVDHSLSVLAARQSNNVMPVHYYNFDQNMRLTPKVQQRKKSN